MLKTETNTQTMRKRVLRAAHESVRFHSRPRKLQADFEHGQWWITDIDTGAQWSVIDAQGRNSIDGFDFEQVTEGESS